MRTAWNKGKTHAYRRPKPLTHPVFLELRGARLERDMSAPSLAPYVGVNPSVLLKCEIGKGNPTFKVLLMWADALGYDITLTPRAADGHTN